MKGQGFYLLIKVYERVGESVILVGTKAQMG